MTITPQQRDYLVANFATTKNEECAAMLGVSLRTTIRMARQLGFIIETQDESDYPTLF